MRGWSLRSPGAREAVHITLLSLLANLLFLVCSALLTKRFDAEEKMFALLSLAGAAPVDVCATGTHECDSLSKSDSFDLLQVKLSARAPADTALMEEEEEHVKKAVKRVKRARAVKQPVIVHVGRLRRRCRCKCVQAPMPVRCEKNLEVHQPGINRLRFSVSVVRAGTTVCVKRIGAGNWRMQLQLRCKRLHPPN